MGGSSEASPARIGLSQQKLKKDLDVPRPARPGQRGKPALGAVAARTGAGHPQRPGGELRDLAPVSGRPLPGPPRRQLLARPLATIPLRPGGHLALRRAALLLWAVVFQLRRLPPAQLAVVQGRRPRQAAGPQGLHDLAGVRRAFERPLGGQKRDHHVRGGTLRSGGPLPRRTGRRPAYAHPAHPPPHGPRVRVEPRAGLGRAGGRVSSLCVRRRGGAGGDAAADRRGDHDPARPQRPGQEGHPLRPRRRRAARAALSHPLPAGLRPAPCRGHETLSPGRPGHRPGPGRLVRRLRRGTDGHGQARGLLYPRRRLALHPPGHGRPVAAAARPPRYARRRPAAGDFPPRRVAGLGPAVTAVRPPLAPSRADRPRHDRNLSQSPRPLVLE